ncbi:MAG: hypothetical protein M0P69_14085 [Bacteroidales bacterium]|jgi:methyl-accepting chemotaxis protein|nr:hypothetical protein [Bacteroidales bacterium]
MKEEIAGQYSEEELDRLLRALDPGRIDAIDFSRLDRVQIEKVFRWSLANQVKELSGDLERLGKVVLSLKQAIEDVGASDLKKRIESVGLGVDELKRLVGTVPLETLREGVQELRLRVESIRESLIRCDITELSARVDTLQTWVHSREVLLSTEVVKDLKESAKSSTAFQIRVMSVGAVLLSLASLFFTVLKMFVIK